MKWKNCVHFKIMPVISIQIRPVIQSTYGLNDVPAAYRQVEAGHLRGKIVVDFTKTD